MSCLGTNHVSNISCYIFVNSGNRKFKLRIHKKIYKCKCTSDNVYISNLETNIIS